MSVYAKAGEAVTCENGHVVGHFTADQERWAPTRSDQFQLVDGSFPQRGSQFGVCPQCGAAAFRSSLQGGVQGHFKEGWRGSNG